MVIKSAVVVVGIAAGLFIAGALAVRRIPASLDDLLGGAHGNGHAAPRSPAGHPRPAAGGGSRPGR